MLAIFAIKRLRWKVTLRLTGMLCWAMRILDVHGWFKSIYCTFHCISRWSHVSEKPLSCDRCSMTFTSKAQFAVHIRTHSAGQNYECNVCGRTFIRDSYLIRWDSDVIESWAQSELRGACTIPVSFFSLVCNSAGTTIACIARIAPQPTVLQR